MCVVGGGGFIVQFLGGEIKIKALCVAGFPHVADPTTVVGFFFFLGGGTENQYKSYKRYVLINFCSCPTFLYAEYQDADYIRVR